MIGTTISHYRITAKLGEGGMGVVYRATDIRLEREVALKFPHPGCYVEDDKERLLREARTAALLHHPNICPIFDVEEADGHLFFAMAYLEADTLTQVLRERPMEVSRALHLIAQILDGLDKAHRQGVIHRDIKSNNILVTPEGHAYILDFGMAISSGATRVTAAGCVTGTPGYMSPEQARGLELDARTDLWSAGVVLFEMLTGVLPFQRAHPVATLHAIIHEPARSLAELRPGLPAGLMGVVEKALCKNPAERWASAREMSAALHREQAPADSLHTVPMMAARKVRISRRALFTLTGAVVVAAIAGVSWWLGVVGYGAALPGEMHIAVLPFQVIGQDENLRATADGLVELLTAQLSQSDNFQGKAIVVPASEIRSRKIASAEDARKIYGANLVITGSAQRLNDRVQFTVILVDAVKTRQLGARSFDFDARNPIALRDGALQRVMDLLKVHLETGTAKPGETRVPEAYAAYLRATGYLARYDLNQNIDRAIESFRDAVKSDPQYAAAYAGLADAYLRKATGTGEKQWSDRALENAQTAARLAADLPAAHATLGRIYGTLGKEDEAIHEFQAALRIAPGDVEVYRNLAEVLTNLGRFTEAEALYLEAVKRRPGDWYGQVLLGLFYKGRDRFPDAEAAYRRAISLTPDNVIAYRLLGSLFKAEGKYPEAIRELQRALKVQRSALVYSVLGVSYYYERKFEDAAAALETAVDLDSSRYTFWGNLGMTYQHIPGKKAKAEASLRQAVELAEKLLAVTPKNYSIRGDLAEYWARQGDRARAERQLGFIPAAFQNQFAPQFALVYELTGQRKKAIQTLPASTGDSALIDVRNDPDMEDFWRDPESQKALAARRGQPQPR